MHHFITNLKKVKMKKVVKQVAGIDVAQKELVITLGRMFDDFTIELFSYKVFKNNDSGIKSLFKFYSTIIL
jgi:hypothetical protein